MTLKEITKYQQEKQDKIKAIEKKFEVKYFNYDSYSKQYVFSKTQFSTFLKLSSEWLNELIK